MDTQTENTNYEFQIRDWMKRVTWMLPMFFLVKGLLWLSLPVVIALYSLD